MSSSSDVLDIEFLNAGYRYALSLSGSEQDAEDLVHDAWIRLDKRYGKCPEKPLLFRTIRNLYIDQYRRQRIIHFSEFNESIPEQSSISNHGQGKESAYASNYMAEEAMLAMLNQLRDVEREALYLSVVEGYTADEVAQMTSSTRGTVLSLVHRAKGKLRQWLSIDTKESEQSEFAAVTEAAANVVVELNHGRRHK